MAGNATRSVLRGFPKMMGRHRVGCVDAMPLPQGETTSLTCRLYYPTDATTGQGYQNATWLPSKKYVEGLTTNFKKYRKLAESFDVHCEQETGVLYEAPVKASVPLPVVMFTHGFGGMRTTSSFACSDLASRGYLVAAVEHRERSACYCYAKQRVNGSFVDNWISYWIPSKDETVEFAENAKQLAARQKEIDISLNLLSDLNKTGCFHNTLQTDFDFKQFMGKVDLDHLALIGHSFGGGTVVESLARNKAFQLGIILDAYLLPLEDFEFIKENISQPLLFINSWTFQRPRYMKMINEILHYNQTTNGYPTKHMITIRDGDHDDLWDIGFTIPDTVRSFSTHDSDEIHSTIMELCNAFLCRHLWKDSTFPIRNLDRAGVGNSEIVFHGTNVQMEQS